MSTGLSPATAPVGVQPNHPWWVLSGVLAAELVDLLDGTILAVAGPDLGADLGASDTDLQWILGSYLLAMGAGLLLGGRLGDRYGARRVYLLGLTGFLVASVLCALAPGPGWLIAARLVQGSLAALILPQGFVLLRAAFGSSRLGRAMAVFGPVMGVGGILGPLVGGGLLAADVGGLGWRTVFLVNLPLGLFSLVVAVRTAPRSGGDPTIGIDLPGALLAAVSAALLVLPLVLGQEAGWPLWTWSSLATATVGLVLFVRRQRHRGRAGLPALVAPQLFGRREFVVGLAGMAVFFAGMVGLPAVLMLLLQQGQGLTAGAAGLTAVGYAGGAFVGSALSGAVLLDRLGRGVLQLGGAVQLCGAAGLAVVASTTSPGPWALLPWLVVWGLGSGLVVAALITVVLAAARDGEVGSASALLAAVQAVAAAAGIALLCGCYFAASTPARGFATAAAVDVALLGCFLALTPLLPRMQPAREGQP